MDRDIHILGLSSGELRPDNQVLLILDHVDRRGPPGVLCPLLIPSSPGDAAAEHLVEQAVHLAQRVVEPAAPISAHHGLHSLLSLSPRIPRRETSILSLPSSSAYTQPPSVPDLSRIRRTLLDTPGRLHPGRATNPESEYQKQHAEGERIGSDQPHQREQTRGCWYYSQQKSE